MLSPPQRYQRTYLGDCGAFYVEYRMSEASSPINRPYKSPGPGGVGGADLSPGARSNPSRGDTSHEGAMPVVPKDQGEKPEPSASPTAKTDSLRGVVEAHLLKHRVLHLPADSLPPSLVAVLAAGR
jgi:hypothetical protein